MTYFPFAEYWWFYLGFTAFVLLMMALDLGVFHRKAHAVGSREALTWSVVWIALALAFNYGFYRYALWSFAENPRLASIPGFSPETAARDVGLEFLAGYVIEKTLSLDNIFIFIVVFGYFGIPAIYQHRILFFGILGALVLRSAFITLGSILLQYHWVLVLFGALLILTGIKMVFAPERKIDPARNPVIRLVQRLLPVTSELHGQRFFVRADGVLHATPLLLTLLFVELTDVIFAVDSVPAIFAITNEPIIVFTSNVFAMLGLRSLYFLLAGAVGRFHLLQYGLAAILVFIGLKMVWLNDVFGGKFPIVWSLAVIGSVIAASTAASLIWPARSSEGNPSKGNGAGNGVALGNR